MDCILCGKCMEVCPLLRATDREELGPRAKAQLSALLSQDSEGLSETSAAALAGLCLGCGRCKRRCTQGVDVPGMVAELRGKHPGFRGWLWKEWLKHSRELWPSTGLAARLVPSRLQPERLSPFLKSMQLLKRGMGMEPFIGIQELPQEYSGKSMMVFSGCTAKYVRSSWQDAALSLLDRLGVEVVKSRFGCCGLGLECAGFESDSKAMRERNIAQWRKADRPQIVVYCASCMAALRDYEQDFEDSEEARAWAEALTPLSSLLAGGQYAVSEDAPLQVGYHRPCHVDKTDFDHIFLAGVLKTGLQKSDERQCCGFGGVMQLGAPDICSKVNDACWHSLAGSQIVLSGCSACVAQLSGTAPHDVKVGHWLDAIDIS